MPNARVEEVGEIEPDETDIENPDELVHRLSKFEGAVANRAFPYSQIPTRRLERSPACFQVERASSRHQTSHHR